MTTWLHWIGRGYYATPATFRREALKVGVTRRVDLWTAGRMAWGDPVWCLMRDGATGVRFGAFRVDRLSGLSADAVAYLADRGLVGEVVDLGGREIQRGCGHYVEGPAFTTTVPLAAIVDVLLAFQAQGGDPGRLMVGGPWEDLPAVRFVDIPQRQGFRTVDAAAVDAAVAAWTGRGMPRLHGQFYLPGAADTPPVATTGVLATVIDYTRAKALLLQRRQNERRAP